MSADKQAPSRRSMPLQTMAKPLSSRKRTAAPSSMPLQGNAEPLPSGKPVPFRSSRHVGATAKSMPSGKRAAAASATPSPMGKPMPGRKQASFRSAASMPATAKPMPSRKRAATPGSMPSKQIAKTMPLGERVTNIDRKSIPQTTEIRKVSLGETLKKRPGRAATRLIGIVPNVATLPNNRPGTPLNADGFTSPPNPGVTDTSVAYHGGATAPGVPVQIIFWGNTWTAEPSATLQWQLIDAAMNLIDGPYYSALGQYGVSGPSFRGAVTVISPNPPASFDDGTIGDLVWNCIDANIFPEPDHSGGRNYYCVMMPPGTSYGPGGALGAHSHPTDYDFPFDFDTAWVAWVGNSDLNTMTRAFAHELAETCTDPEGDAWYVDNGGNEIGDLCNTSQGWVNGVYVEGYWAKNTGACVIPQCAEVMSGVSRSSDKLDVFAVGTDGGIYTAAWEPGDPGWQGWWQVAGGIAAPGTSVFGVSRSADKLDIFAVGTDFGIYTAAWEPGDPRWQGWWRIGTLTVAPGSNVYAVSRRLDRLDIFAVASDGGIYTSGWEPGDAGWEPWSQVAGGVAAPGTSVFGVSQSTDKLDIFAVGTDHGIYTAAWEPGDPGWQGWWQVAGGVAAPGTSVFGVSRSTDKLDIFAVGTDHGIYTAAWEPGDPGWQGWWQVAGGVAAPGTSVFGVSRSTDKLDIFAVGTDYGIYTAAWEPGDPGWQGWWQVAGGVAAPGTSVFGVSRSTDKLDIFAVGTDHGIYTAAWEPAIKAGRDGGKSRAVSQTGECRSSSERLCAFVVRAREGHVWTAPRRQGFG